MLGTQQESTQAERPSRVTNLVSALYRVCNVRNLVRDLSVQVGARSGEAEPIKDFDVEKDLIGALDSVTKEINIACDEISTNLENLKEELF